jgi:hypothetical protein
MKMEGNGKNTLFILPALIYLNSYAECTKDSPVKLLVYYKYLPLHAKNPP